MKHVVSFSGGVGSYAATKRIIERGVKREDITLLFADTLIEDADLYRFLDEAASKLDCELVKIADGRTPWQVFKDSRFLGNTRVARCSIELKRELLDNWVADRFDPADVVYVFGIDWTEQHRLERLKEAKPGWHCIAPMCDRPLVSKAKMLAELADDGIELPRLYKLGFPHNNCGGGCVKAGQAHFLHLLKNLPEVFAEWEANEEDVRQFLGRDDASILRDRTGGETKPLTLRELRERHEAGGQLDLFEWGGCGCAVDW